MKNQLSLTYDLHHRAVCFKPLPTVFDHRFDCIYTFIRRPAVPYDRRELCYTVTPPVFPPEPSEEK